jgi:tRNA/rRNA methyltransferase
LLMSYEWMKSGMEDLSATAFAANRQRPSTKEQLFGLFEQVEEALESRNYFHPVEKKPKMIDNLRAVFSRQAFTEQEISVMRGVISSLDRFPRKLPRGSRTAAPKEKPSDDSADD